MTDAATAPRLVASTHQPEPTAAPRIRRYVRALLSNWGVDPEAVEDAVLVVEELVANVCDHAHTRFELIIRLSGRMLRVAVHDESVDDPEIQPFDPHASRGRGLQLVARLSQRWGYDHRDGGKTVWADLAA